MEQLTEAQAKMVIEFFSAQAAEDAPEGEGLSESYLWKTRYQASIALDRRIGEWWWTSLVECQMDLQSFDRDPAGYLYERGEADWGSAIDDMGEHLKNQVSWSIDNAFRNSGA